MSRGRTLLIAVSDELAEIRARLEDLSGLTSELMAHCPDDRRGAALARIQDFDLLIQRLDGLSGMSAALGAGVPVETALHALTLSDLAQRLGPAPARSADPWSSGDLMLFD